MRVVIGRWIIFLAIDRLIRRTNLSDALIAVSWGLRVIFSRIEASCAQFPLFYDLVCSPVRHFCVSWEAHYSGLACRPFQFPISCSPSSHMPIAPESCLPLNLFFSPVNRTGFVLGFAGALAVWSFPFSRYPNLRRIYVQIGTFYSTVDEIYSLGLFRAAPLPFRQILCYLVLGGASFLRTSSRCARHWGLSHAPWATGYRTIPRLALRRRARIEVL